MSPTPETAESPATAVVNGARGDGESSTKDHKERTIALLNVPDIVTAARLEKLVTEQAGPIKKFTLRPDHAGAIVEFVDIASVGKAQMALHDYEIEDHKLGVGTVPQLLKQDAEVKREEVKSKKKVENKKAFGAPVARPAQGGASMRGRGGRRGGLGFVKRSVQPKEGEDKEGPKSNDYFRDLMSKNSAVKEVEEKSEEQEKKIEVSQLVNDNEDDGDLLDDIMGGGDDEAALNGDAVNGGGEGGDDGLLDDLMDD
jgi:hypothetical protein